jgi:hypothetical protein
MAIPKEKSVAVQLVPTVAAGVASALLTRAVWHGATGGDAPVWAALVVGFSVAAAFYWCYGWMQRRQ